jgi:LPS export ABC transporter protein LptC
MLTSLRNVLLALLLVGAAAASWYLSFPQSDGELRRDADRETGLGYYLKGAVFRGMNAEGRLVYEITAARIQENPGSEYLTLEDVEITYFESEGVPWFASAAQATTPISRAFVDLSGTVRLSSTNDDAGQRTMIEADAMRLEPERYFATSEGPARIAVGENWMTASRLEADLKDDVVRGSNVYAEISR